MCYSHPSCNILSIPICFSPFLFQLKIGEGKVNFLAKFFVTLAATFKEYSVGIFMLVTRLKDID